MSDDNRISELDRALLVISTVVLLVVASLLVFNLYAQGSAYRAAMTTALSSPDSVALVLAFGRALDFAIVKTTVVFTGVLLSLLGALYVLRVVRAPIEMSGRWEHGSGSLRTASPGLVMIVLGTLTVNVSLFAKTEVSVASSLQFTRKGATATDVAGVRPTPGERREPPPATPLARKPERRLRFELTPDGALPSDVSVQLERLAAEMAAASRRLKKDGHPDDSDTLYIYADNLPLSPAARSLVRDLEKLGIPSNHIKIDTIGMGVPGEGRPAIIVAVVPTETPADTSPPQ